MICQENIIYLNINKNVSLYYNLRDQIDWMFVIAFEMPIVDSLKDVPGGFRLCGRTSTLVRRFD